MNSTDRDPIDDSKDNPNGGILGEAVLVYTENLNDEGTCSCVCIDNEQCCGCMIQ